MDPRQQNYSQRTKAISNVFNKSQSVMIWHDSSPELTGWASSRETDEFQTAWKNDFFTILEFLSSMGRMDPPARDTTEIRSHRTNGSSQERGTVLKKWRVDSLGRPSHPARPNTDPGNCFGAIAPLLKARTVVHISIKMMFWNIVIRSPPEFAIRTRSWNLTSINGSFY